MHLAKLSLPLAGLLTLSSFLLVSACSEDESSSSGNPSSQGGSGGSGTAGSSTAGSGGSDTAGSGGSGQAGTNASGSGGSAGGDAGAGGSETAGSGGSDTAGSGGSETAGSGGTDAAGTGGTDAAGSGGTDAGGSAGAGGGEPGPMCSGGAAQDGNLPANPQDCAAVGSFDCFSNYDCCGTDRCETLVNEAVICCVKGERGKGKVGEACKGEADCQSALCLDSAKVGTVCTDRCNSEADCPDGMKQCIPIAFSGSDDKFCAPSAN